MSFRLRPTREYELQIPPSHRTAFDNAQAGLGRQRNEVARVHSAVSMKVGEQSLSRASHEIDGEETTAGLEHTPRFTDRLHWTGPGEVMQHDGAEYHVELCVGKG